VFGEIFGGCYPHKDVQPIPFIKKVQHGIWYSPNIEFAAYELQTIQRDNSPTKDTNITGSELRDVDQGPIENETSSTIVSIPSGHRYTFLDFDVARDFLVRNGLFALKELARGKLHEIAAKFDIERFFTTIPQILGLPPITGNLAEGIVFKTTTVTGKGFHSMLKYKRQGMSEVEQKSKLPRLGNTPQALEILRIMLAGHKQATDALENALRYVSRNRASNVLSKLGNHFADISQTSYLMALLLRDSWKDFAKEMREPADLIQSLSREMRRAIESYLEEKAKLIIFSLIEDVSGIKLVETVFHV